MTKICLKFTFNACKRNKALKKLRNLKQTQNKPPFFSLALDSARRFHRLLLLNFPVKTAIVICRNFPKKILSLLLPPPKADKRLVRQLNLGSLHCPDFWDEYFCKIFHMFIWEGGLAGFPRSRFFQPGSFYAKWLYVNWAQFNLVGAPLSGDNFSNITNNSYGLKNHLIHNHSTL